MPWNLVSAETSKVPMVASAMVLVAVAPPAADRVKVVSPVMGASARLLRLNTFGPLMVNVMDVVVGSEMTLFDPLMGE